MRYNLAILASGSGTNTQNIAEYFENNPKISVRLIVSNKSNAFVLERAKQLKIDSLVLNKTDWDDEKLVKNIFKQYDIDFIVLAGYLLKIPAYLINIYPNKIINIHPALLPKFGGKGMYGDNVHQAVVEAQEQESGITIHYCNEHYDKGDIIFQAKCEVTPTDNYEDVATKVHALEYEHFPKVIEKLLLNINGVG